MAWHKKAKETPEEKKARRAKEAETRKKKNAAVGIKKNGPKPKQEEFVNGMNRFLSLHFQTDGTHSGTVVLQTKGSVYLEEGAQISAAPEMKYVGFAKPEKLAEYICGLRLAKDNAYYISCNSFTKGRRRKNEAFTLHNIVIDIDCHQGQDYDKTKHMLEGFVYFLDEFCHDYGIPMPNTVNYTGRGVQLWWALEPISAKCNKMYKYTAEYFKRQLDQAISDHDQFAALSVDWGASGNIAGLYRLPFTLNQKTGTYGTLEFIHDKQLVLPIAYEEAYESRQETVPLFIRRPKTGNPKETADKRVSVLFELAKTRIHAGEETKGFRDNFAFCLYNSMIHAYSDEETMAQVKKLNAMFPDPLPEHELETYMSTSRGKAAMGKPYLLRNTEIIERLAVTYEEQCHVRLFTTTQKPSEELRKEAREAKAKRDRKILSLATELDTKKEIAKRVGCSESTVANVLKKNGKKTGAERVRRSLCFALVKGMEMEKAAKKYGRSIKNVRELGKMVKDKKLDTVVGKKHMAPLEGKESKNAIVSQYDEESWDMLVTQYNIKELAYGRPGNTYLKRAPALVSACA